MPMMRANPAMTVAVDTDPVSNRTTITSSITQRIAKLEATVPNANTVAPANAAAKTRGCSLIIEPINCALRRARDLLDVEFRSGTPRFYQPSDAIASEVVVTHDAHSTGSPSPGRNDSPNGGHTRTGITAFRVLFPIGAVIFVSFWTWALFFASKTAVNKIGDEAWAERAESICAPVKDQLRQFELNADPDLNVRANLVDESTDLLATMIDDVDAVAPADDKGKAIVPDWIADWRTLIQNRYDYADRLRAGENVAFTEAQRNGVPISEPIETFAGDNDMDSCAPPHGSLL